MAGRSLASYGGEDESPERRMTDYCEIDVQTLRQFQSSHRSPPKPFKPVPDGFEIDLGRKVLPTGDN